MSIESNDDPAWVAKLGLVDRKIARTLLRHPGEGVLRRIAVAIQKTTNRRGAPAKPIPDAWLATGYRLWLTSKEESFRAIAEKIVPSDHAWAAGERKRRVRALEENFRRFVRERCHKLKNELVQDRQVRLKNPDVFDAIEHELIGNRQVVRKSPEKDRQHTLSVFLSLFGRRRVSVSSQFSNDASEKNTSILRIHSKHKIYGCSEKEDLFYLAFEDIIPGNLPVREGRKLYFEIRSFLEDEAKRTLTTKKD